MHRSYQPLKPVTNRYLQQRWDQKDFENHCNKVNFALPIVDTKDIKTPVHLQLKLKKLQLQDEQQCAIDRNNRLLASKLASIVCSKGLLDNRNQYHLRSLNGSKRKQELRLISHQNQSMYQRIRSHQSEYRRELWMEDWERTEQKLDNISMYPKGLAGTQRLQKKVKFAAVDGSKPSTRCSRSEKTNKETRNPVQHPV